jgi:hypothetical protein
LFLGPLAMPSMEFTFYPVMGTVCSHFLILWPCTL